MDSGYYIGQILPLDAEKAIQHGTGVDAWYAFQTPPQREASAKAWLERRGLDVWYPTEIRHRRLVRGPRKSVPYEARIVPRYVFVRFTGFPNWAVVQSCRWLTRVVGIGEDPLPITSRMMTRMKLFPKRMEIIRRREADRKIVRPGDKVLILDGAMSGWVVDIRSVHEGMARFLVPLLGEHEVEVEVGRVALVAVDDRNSSA